MAKHKYKLLTQDVIDQLSPGAELGDEAELDLSAEQRKAVVAAGWVEPLDDDEPDEPKGKGGTK